MFDVRHFVDILVYTRGGGVGGKEKARGVCRLGEVGVHE